MASTNSICSSTSSSLACCKSCEFICCAPVLVNETILARIPVHVEPARYAPSQDDGEFRRPGRHFIRVRWCRRISRSV
jgi:hypothetical protein